MPDPSPVFGRETSSRPSRASLRTAVVWDVLKDALDRRVKATGKDSLDVLDTGGGSGNFEYSWFQRSDASTTWQPLDSRERTQAVTMLGDGFSVRVDVLDRVTRLSASATLHVAFQNAPTGKDVVR